jgi:hypothetical protein
LDRRLDECHIWSVLYGEEKSTYLRIEKGTTNERNVFSLMAVSKELQQLTCNSGLK